MTKIGMGCRVGVTRRDEEGEGGRREDERERERRRERREGGREGRGKREKKKTNVAADRGKVEDGAGLDEREISRNK